MQSISSLQRDRLSSIAVTRKPLISRVENEVWWRLLHNAANIAAMASRSEALFFGYGVI
jgi:hypothetical protein